MYSVQMLNLAAGVICCLAATGVAGEKAGPPAVDRRLAYSWRAYSQRLDYDRGGHGTLGADKTSRELVLTPDGTWTFGSSHGKWSVQPITKDDWSRWKVKAYGPTEKIVLEGWSGKGADGPIEASKRAGWVDFFWLIYHIDKPEAGVMSVKYGHVNRDLK